MIKAKRDFATERKVIFAAMSKRNFFLREHIVRFILNKGFTPTCAFMMFSYFLLDTVDRKALISANNDLVRRSDELWVFGEISDGVKAEVNLAKRLGRPVCYFINGSKAGIFKRVKESDAKYEV